VPDPNTPAASLAPPPATSQCTLDQLQLHIGDRLQLELLTDSTRSHYYTVLVGYVPGHSVMLRTPLVQNLPIPIREGEPVLVRTFSGRHASTFESTVVRVCRTPFPYLHLGYPATVQRTLIRGALRVRVSIPGTISNPQQQEETHPAAMSVADLSVSGALIESAQALGDAGDAIEIAFRFVVEPNNYEVKLVTGARIQSVRKTRAAQGAGDIHVHGVRFNRLHATESLLLQSYIQQVLLADRSRVV